jgi:ribonuclease R
LIGQNRGQSFSLGDEVKIQVAGVNLEERKIDFQLVQQLTHLGRVIRQKAPRTNLQIASTTEEVFGKAHRQQLKSVKMVKSLCVRKRIRTNQVLIPKNQLKKLQLSLKPKRKPRRK